MRAESTKYLCKGLPEEIAVVLLAPDQFFGNRTDCFDGSVFVPLGYWEHFKEVGVEGSG